MAIGTIIALTGLAITAASAGTSAYFQQQASKASEKAEGVRKKMMKLEASRKRRKAIREGIIARSEAAAAAGARGINPGSSPFAAALDTASAGSDRTVANIGQNEQAAGSLFTANAANARASGNQGVADAAAGVGAGLFKNSKEIGNTLTQQFPSLGA